ncbi:MAG: hypothetical protein KY464_04000 [Gemmatimonadetes bacterium]|nr:hypothetical protein [Gemmatimonadota bacterium]
MTGRSPLRAPLVVAICAASVGVSVWSLAFSSAATPSADLPRAEELDSLSRYLAPVAPAPRLDDYAVFLPARRAPRYQPAAPPPIIETAPSVWELSAIMITGARPVAIINDQTVVAGARLPDGAVVLEIERDHVVIREPNGTRRRLVLAAG